MMEWVWFGLGVAFIFVVAFALRTYVKPRLELGTKPTWSWTRYTTPARKTPEEIIAEQLLSFRKEYYGSDLIMKNPEASRRAAKYILQALEHHGYYLDE